ncbi:enoyl-CoA hydratase/isomerase family protein [Pararhizobium haloflavum]|uniref:enoyl-CoA hydratase/isomerase family protein n=1 Tax=Pararhizobium haloflavum TaxID=2037914 RepID=UPI000C195874|nr:enoyl-CoA hydratase/isomerase family protein [Pararhizobium haloflavum]
MDRPGLQVTRADGVLRVHIDRAEKRNALSRSLLAAIGEAFRESAADNSLKLALLTSAGDRSFAAGGDLRDLAEVQGDLAAEEMARDAKHALQAIRDFPVPVVAGLNGDALGGGAELAVACDMRVAAAHARIGFIQGRLAIASAWGGGVDLMRLVGPSRALRLLARSEMLDAEQAITMGLIDAAAGESETLDEAMDRFISPMLSQAPQVMRAFKALAIEAKNAGRDTMDGIETARFGEVWAHPDHDAAVDAILNKAKRA